MEVTDDFSLLLKPSPIPVDPWSFHRWDKFPDYQVKEDVLTCLQPTPAVLGKAVQEHREPRNSCNSGGREMPPGHLDGEDEGREQVFVCIPADSSLPRPG
jgi:hypothetical protein